MRKPSQGSIYPTNKFLCSPLWVIVYRVLTVQKSIIYHLRAEGWPKLKFLAFLLEELFIEEFV